MQKISIVDIQHKTFKKALQGYDRTEVDQFLDEVIESMEDEAHHRASLEAELADLRDRISHFKSMEESLQNTLLLAQRTADEIKASAHKEADLIKAEARLATERDLAAQAGRAEDGRREAQRAIDAAEKARSELRSLLMTHMALLDRPTAQAIANNSAAVESISAPVSSNGPAVSVPVQA